MNRQINEHDELLLNRLLDGDLPAHEAEVLRDRIRHEPGLLEIFESLARLNRVLASRQADEPRIDWHRFHDSITRAIRAEAIPSETFKLARWLRVGAPLAAAAAIVLLITVYQIRTPKSAITGNLSDTSVVANAPYADGDGKIVIRYQRDSTRNQAVSGSMHVSYGRSTEVAETYRQRDESYRTADPSWQWFETVKVSSPPIASDSMEVPPI